MNNKSNINILFVMLQMKPGGAEKIIYEIISGLDRTVFSPSVAWFKDDDLVDDFSKIADSLHFVPKIRRFDIKSMLQLAQVIQSTDAKIINAHHLMPLVYSYYGYLKSKGVKLVYTEHSAWEVSTGSKIWNLIKKYMLKNSSAIIGVSDEVTNALVSKYKLERNIVHTIKNGINIDKFKIINSGNLNFYLPENKIKIVMVANLRKNKNHIFLLKAFAELLKLNNNVHLFLIGQSFHDDPENSEIEIRQTISSLDISDHVSLLGYRQNVNELLPMMDIACLCSDKEGLPMSLIEAMAAGLPLVGTNVDGIKDVIINNYNGFLVSKDDIKGFSQYLNLLALDSTTRKLFGQRSHKLALDNYNMQDSIKKFEKLLTKLSQI